MSTEYPRECRLAVELIARLGRPVDDLLLQQHELLRTAASLFALNYHGFNPYVREMKRTMAQPSTPSTRGRRMTLKQMLAVVKIMKDELEDS